MAAHETYYDRSRDPNAGRKGLRPVFTCRSCGYAATEAAFPRFECSSREQQLAERRADALDFERRQEAARAESRERSRERQKMQRRRRRAQREGLVK